MLQSYPDQKFHREVHEGGAGSRRLSAQKCYQSKKATLGKEQADHEDNSTYILLCLNYKLIKMYNNSGNPHNRDYS